MKRIDGKKLMLVLCAGALPVLGCVIPPPQAPSAAPGSAASIGNKSGGGATTAVTGSARTAARTA